MPAARSRKPAIRTRAQAARLFKVLRESQPVPQVELHHRTALQLLIATILSAQCTDQRVNQVTPALFRRFPTAADYAAADQLELEGLIKSTGFFKSKARSIIGCCRALIAHFQGEVPDTMEALVTLPGVGRKTANVVLGNHFGKPAVIVDTHVARVSQRLGLSTSEDPERIEEDLQRLLPPDEWTAGSQRLLLHGRYVCLARAPKCPACGVYHLCHWKGKQTR